MLARTFKAARQLGISEVDRQAAIEVLGMLERGELKYVNLKYGYAKTLKPHRAGLNMSMWSDERAGPFCGCIGGWMEKVKGRALGERCLDKWDDLFRPSAFQFHPEFYTPERCARALYGKLTTGKADWGK